MGVACRERLRGPARVALLLCACLAGPGPGRLEAQLHLAGEYGLWVTERGPDLHVGWLTEETVPGVLEVMRDGERLHRFETPPAQGHSADFPRPDDGPLVLRYGALDDDGAGPGRVDTTTVYLTRKEEAPPGVLTGVDSLFAVGDVHGEYDHLLGLLRGAGLVDADGRWSGGRKHVAFLGDLFDRGPDVTRALWFLYRLEREAARAGGGVHVVLGNHETMIFTNDLRYVSSKERLVAEMHGTTYPRLFDIRHSILGRWLASRPGLMEVDGALLAHGGVTPAYARYAVREFNDSLRTFLGEDFFYYLDEIFDPEDTTAALVGDSSLVGRLPVEHVVVMDTVAAQRRLDFVFADTSVFWFRGYVQSDTLSDALGEVLDRYDAVVHVVGHTAGATVRSRYGGRLLAVDLNDPATEMVLLVRDGAGGYRTVRYTEEGPAGAVPAEGEPGGRGRAPPGDGALPRGLRHVGREPGHMAGVGCPLLMPHTTFHAPVSSCRRSSM